MTLVVYTAPLSYAGDDRLDVSRLGNHPRGAAFAPSWAILRPYQAAKAAGRATRERWLAYVADYTSEMRASYCYRRDDWRWLLAQRAVTLCCYCRAGEPCHRVELARLLVRLGARYEGER